MTRGSRTLCTLHTLVALWLTFCTVQTWGTAAIWGTLSMAAASIIPLLAIAREYDLRDARRHAAALEERATRKHRQRHGRPLNQREAATFQRLVDSLDLDTPDDPRSTTT